MLSYCSCVGSVAAAGGTHQRGALCMARRCRRDCDRVLREQTGEEEVPTAKIHSCPRAELINVFVLTNY